MINRKQKELDEFIKEIDRVWKLSLNEKELLEEHLNTLLNQNSDYFNLLVAIPRAETEYFAEVYLDMVEETECDCEEFELSEVSDYDLVEECNIRGIVFKEYDIVTDMQLEEMKELFLSLPTHKREELINDLKKR